MRCIPGMYWNVFVNRIPAPPPLGYISLRIGVFGSILYIGMGVKARFCSRKCRLHDLHRTPLCKTEKYTIFSLHCNTSTIHSKNAFRRWATLLFSASDITWLYISIFCQTWVIKWIAYSQCRREMLSANLSALGYVMYGIVIEAKVQLEPVFEPIREVLPIQRIANRM